MLKLCLSSPWTKVNQISIFQILEQSASWTLFQCSTDKYSLEQIIVGTEIFLSPKISAYRKSYSTQHVITFIIENWQEKLDQNILVGTVLTDFSKAFNCIHHDLLIAKLAVYGFDLNALSLIFTYLKNWKQSIGVNSKHSSLRNITSGVPQGSFIGPILLNLSLNDLFYIIEKPQY